MVQISYIIWYRSQRDLHSLGPAVLGVYKSHRDLYPVIYRISLKSRRTLKSRRPRNVAASICQLVPVNAALEISLRGKGSTAISVCTRAFYVYIIVEAVYARVDLCRCRPRIVAASNGALK